MLWNLWTRWQHDRQALQCARSAVVTSAQSWHGGCGLNTGWLISNFFNILQFVVWKGQNNEPPICVLHTHSPHQPPNPNFPSYHMKGMLLPALSLNIGIRCKIRYVKSLNIGIQKLRILGDQLAVLDFCHFGHSPFNLRWKEQKLFYSQHLKQNNMNREKQCNHFL